MKAFVFKPSNALIGKFDVSSPDEVAEALVRFGENHTLSPYDYVECSGKTWTLIKGTDGYDLVEGREYAPKGAVSASDSSGVSTQGDVSSRYSDAYTTAGAITGIGGIIKGIGIAFGLVVILAGFVAGGDTRGFEWVIVVFGSLISGVLGGTILYVIGVLVSAQGQILKATLDSAVHLSPFLTDSQKASVMRLKP